MAANRRLATTRIAELAKRAAAILIDQAEKGKNTNSIDPWRLGRKPPKRKAKGEDCDSAAGRSD